MVNPVIMCSDYDKQNLKAQIYVRLSVPEVHYPVQLHNRSYRIMYKILLDPTPLLVYSV